MGNSASIKSTQAVIGNLPELLACTYENTPILTLEGQETLAKCVRVYDGDTVHLAIAVEQGGAPVFRRVRCRLAHLNTAELNSRDIVEANKARVAKQALADLIDDKVCHVKFGRDDMYGRPLVTIFLYDTTTGTIGENVNSRMLSAGFAKSYEGAGKKEF